MKYLIVATLWTAYCALHSYLISISFTNLMVRLTAKYYAFYRMFFALVSFVLLIPLLYYTAGVESTIIITYGFPLNIIRLALIAASMAFFFWAFLFSYDPLSFVGIRQITDMRNGKAKISKRLSKKGPLGIVRHPMYIALIVYLWCQIFTIKDLVVSTILTIYIIIGTKLEEKKLVLEFGDEYLKYQQEVPILIPFKKVRPQSKAHDLHIGYL